MRRPLFLAASILMFVLAAGTSTGLAEKEPIIIDSTTITIVPIVLYPANPATASESLSLIPGDSIFVYDGDLFFRARARGRDFFVSKSQILGHSDSLIIYQNFRLISGAVAPAIADSARKVERRQCSMITKNGSRCKRLALPGSDRCWQHKK